jgi:hypothetical protein
VNKMFQIHWKQFRELESVLGDFERKLREQEL